MRVQRGTVAGLLASMVVSSCGRCGAPTSVAELTQLSGAVQRDWARAQGDFTAAVAGERFFPGDGVRTSSAAWARLLLTEHQVELTVEPLSLVRFSADAGASISAIVVETGSAQLLGGGAFSTQLGIARLLPGSRARLVSSGPGKQSLVVLVGGAKIISRGGRESLLEAGQAFEIELGRAVLRRIGASDVTTASTANIETGAKTATAAAEDVPRLPARPPRVGRPPTKVLVVVSAGESAVIHDPAGSTPVAIQAQPACSGEAVVELWRRSTLLAREIGAGALRLQLPPGASRYKVECLIEGGVSMEGPVGSLEVVRDAGAARLRLNPPENTLDSDGRSYRVLYQNVLPRITLRWRNAPPKSRSLRLHLTGPGGERTRALAAPVALFESGTLQEGSYRWWFDVPGVERSPVTILEIDFDNAAPAAYFVAPTSRTDTGTVAEVQGVSLPGSDVHVDGARATTDRHGRFSARLAADAEVVVVRIDHPRRGVHYYVRRLPRAP